MSSHHVDTAGLAGTQDFLDLNCEESRERMISLVE
jgi:hypothetical protein